MSNTGEGGNVSRKCRFPKGLQWKSVSEGAFHLDFSPALYLGRLEDPYHALVSSLQIR